jgi:hypothetical protein
MKPYDDDDSLEPDFAAAAQACFAEDWKSPEDSIYDDA